jgi:hypothetical protein
MDYIPNMTIEQRFMEELGVPVTKLELLDSGPLFVEGFFIFA